MVLDPSTSQQQNLPFEANDKAERRRMIRAIDWQRTGLSERRWAKCVEVLCYFVGIDFDGIFPRLDTITKACGLKTKRTTQRVMSDLIDLGVVKSRQRGRTSNEYQIDFRKLTSLGILGSQKLSTQAADFVTSDSPFCPLCGSELSPLHNKELTNKESNYSSTSSTLGDKQTVTSNATVIAEEEEEVRILKNKFREKFPDALYIEAAIDEAIATGCSLEQLYARGKYFLKHRHEWSENHRCGALFTGIKLSHPNLAHDRGWPSKR